MMVLLTIIIFFYLTNLFGHLFHWLLHQSWSGSLNKTHMSHHLDLYPSNDFYSREYRKPTLKDSSPKLFIIGAIPLLLLPVILWVFGIFSFIMVVAAITTILSIGVLDYYFHDWFHIKDHWITKIPFFNKVFDRWVKLHYLHHVDMQKNFGIFNFFWDKVCKSYWNNTNIQIPKIKE